ncbi:MAG TPA: right-handed parallel beta-helix repeat-containing protein [Candidatus Poseidoniia archaeon]|nr:right-handed parallel beta-helix repeat-containing protein [Candidatus Poseidoniia archaeon]
MKDNSKDGISSHGMFTKIINNTIKFNGQKGIVLEDTAARSTILDCILDDNEENAIHIFANHVLINATVVDGDTSDIAILVVNSNFVKIMNTTVEGGSQGIKFQNSTNAFVYKNTVKSNTAYGIYLMQNSTSAQVKNNTVMDNGQQSIYIHTSSSAIINGNTLKENDGYGLIATNSKFLQINDNTVEDNGGGIKFSDCDYCNVTSTSIKDNIARGIWLLSDSDNNSFTHVNSSDNNKDVYFQSSKDNKGFNFSFSTVTIDSSSTLTLTSNLDIVFQSSGGSGFPGFHFELISGGVQFYATPFYGGTDSVSDLDGEVGETFSLDYEIYNGSSTPDLVSNVLKYHYGVRSKEKSLDMSNSHTETVSVPSYWTKGLVRNADTGTNYYKIQYAIDNASAGHTLNVWAWTYNEAILIDESITLIGNSSSTTKIVAGSAQYNSDLDSVIEISSDNVTLSRLTIIQNSTNFSFVVKAHNDDIVISNSIIDYWISSAYGRIALYVTGDNSIISNNSIYEAEWCVQLTYSDGHLVENNILGRESSVSDPSKCMFAVSNSDNNAIRNNTFTDSRYGLTLVDSSNNVVLNNSLTLVNASSDQRGIRLDGSSTNNQIVNNTVSGYGSGIESRSDSNYFSGNILDGNTYGLDISNLAEYNKFESNTIKNSLDYGVWIHGSSQSNEFWNNTISSSDEYDFYLEDNSTNNYVINTTFSTVSVDSSSSLFIKEYLVLRTKDASGDHISGIDIRVLENTTVRYETSYFGGTDSKTDINGTIPTFLLDTRKYQGSSTPLVIPTYASARYHDWVETSTYDAHDVIQITVPDLRVKNNRTGEMTYNLETAINNATSGDLIFAWAGIYYEHIEIDKLLTIKGNGTSTIINGTGSGTAIWITNDDVSIENLMILSVEKGIFVDASDDVSVENVKFSGTTFYGEYSLYVDDSQNLYVRNSVFDVDDFGIYFTGSSSNAVVRDNVFRNGSGDGVGDGPGDNCIFQSSSDETGDTQIINNTFDNCDVGWKSGSSGNTFRDNTLNDNNYGIIINGIEAYGNLVTGNTIKDSNYGIRIYNGAHDNNLFSNTIQDSANSDIKLGESEDTISFNNTFSTISVNSNANMWVKVYLDLTVYDNSSNAFSNADIEVKENNLVLYSTDYFGGSDDRTDVNGTIETFLVAISHYNGSSVPDDVATNVSVRFVDWTISGTYNVSNSLSFLVPDFRVQNQDNGNMFYSIGGAISASSTSNGHVIQAWTGTYRELITIDKQITLVGNGTSKTILNGSFEGTIITVSTDNVNIRNLSIMSSYVQAGYRGIMLYSANCELDNLVLGYHYVGIWDDSQFNKISNSVIHHSNHGIKVQGGSASSIINNTFTDNIQGLLVYSAEEVIISNNTFNNNIKAVETDSSIDVTIRGNTFSNNDGEAIIMGASDDITVHDNILQNNSVGVRINGGSSDIILYNNTIEYHLNYGFYIENLESSVFSNNIIKMNSQAFEIRNSNSVTFISNTFVSNDYSYSTIYGYSGTNTLESNTFDDTGIAIEGADQILESNTIINSPEYGVKIHRNSYDNKLFNNTISNSDEKDIFVGGLFNQTNNIGYNNTFSTIEVESNGEFIILDYVNVKTVNATGDKSGIDIRSYYSSSFYYRSTYFGGTDPLTNSSGDIPSFLAPVEHYDGSSTPDSVSLPVRARFVDWVETFYLDTSQSDSITIDIPDLRVKNIDTEAMSYHIQTAIDNAYVDDRIYVMAGLYLENVAVYKQITLATCEPESYGTCYTDGSVLIDAQQNGSAIKISEDGAEIRGFTVTNASSWPEAGIRVQADNTEVWGCNAYGSPIGILLQGASGTNLKSNSVFGTNIGIWLTASSNNFMDVTTIYDTSITDISFDSYGYADSEGSENNVLDRMRIKKINFTNSPNNLIQWPESIDYYQFEKVTLVNSQNVVSVGYDDPASIEIDSDSSYFVKNHVNIHVSQNGTFLSDVDVKIWNETEVFYSTPLFGGTDSKTVAGTIESVKTFAFKEYIGNSSGSENSIKVRIAYIDWTDETELSGSDGYPGFCHQCTIYADFDVPMFRVYNEDAEEYYYYIQPAIENATAGDTISLDSMEYNENIVIDKPLTLSGDSRDTTILTVDISGLGSPPLANSSLEGISITADDVVIENLQISNFSLGIRIYDADRVRISNVRIMDTNGKGIWGLVWTTDLEIIDTIVDSAGGIGIEVHDNSAGFSLRDSVITNSQGGVTISTTGSYGASIDNVTVADNSNYGIHISAPGSTISNSTIENNGMNGIKLQAVTSANIENNTIFDNGLTEIYMVSSYNVDIYGNSISDEYDGVGISASASENVAISHNEMSLSIHLNSSYSQISDNNFTDIFGGSVSYDDAAMVISGNNNTISDNNIDNVELAFVFLYGNHDYNLVENNTLTFTSDDIWYYTSGMNNRFINTDLGIVDISEDSYFELLNYIDIEMSTINGPATNVELDVHYTSGPSIYNTGRYGGSDSKTDSSGTIERLFIVYQVFDGDYVPDTLETRVTYYYDGAEYNFTLDTSISHLVEIAVNLRPIASIDQISGIGDNPSTSTEEAVKGADILMMDNHTVAYWPFGEGSGQTVTDDTEAAYTGIIRPAAIWNEGRPNATDSSSVEFDGSFTNIETTATFELTEFTAEVWFKTDTTKKMVLFSDKDNSQKWGYNMYIDNGLAFDFTVNNGGQVFRLAPAESVTDNQWHFAAVVRDSSSVQLWLDGELVAGFSWSGDIDFTLSPIYIGQNPLGSESFKGLIDDLRFSDIARHNEDFMTGGGIVVFESDSYDPDGQISEYIWSSAIDGELGRGQTLYFAVDDLTQGSHNIQLHVMDDNGTFSVIPDSLVLLVMERPDSTIFSIAVNGDSVWSGWGSIEANSGDNISFKGRTNSQQSISEFSWASDQDGVISTVAEFDIDTLSNGTHAITFKLKGTNGLWSAEQEVRIDINGRPAIGNSHVTSETLDRLKSAMFKVRIEDDNTDGSSLVYDVGYRIKGGGGEWESEYISDTSYNSGTGDLEFTFTPDQNAPTGVYEFFVEATDEEGGVSDYYIMSQSITVQNNEPEIEQSSLDTDGEPLEFTTGTTIELGVDSTDQDGIVSTVIWYADNDGDGTLEEIGTGANFSFDNQLAPGENTIRVRVLDNEGGYSEQEFMVIVKEAPVEATLIDSLVEDFSSNLPLIALLGGGMVMVVGTILLRRRKVTEVVAEGLEVDDGVSEQPRETFDTLEWDIPTDAQGNALIIGEYMAKRRESYLTYPNNDEVLDYLHNNRERFQISSYFDVPAEPPAVLTDWALPDNLRGNVHLDSPRKQIVDRITTSSPDKNFVIIGEPGVGKTVMMFEVFDRLMYQAPVGILTTDMIAKAHVLFGVRVFYDDIPENQKLVEALTDNEIQGVIVTSREADWKALPTEMQAKFDRLTVPLFNELDMKEMIKKMMTFQSIGFNEKAIDLLAEYSEGSPIYVWSMVREMMHRSVKSLSEEYIKENSIKGMINYVAQLLQRLLKDGEEYRSGGLHALASLIFLSDHMEERYCNDYFFDAYVEVLSKHTEEKLDDKMNPKTLNLVLAYLPINDSVIRFPHDTWPDVLQGWGDMNPFSSELRMINRLFADSGLFQSLKKEVVNDVWNSTYERYKRTPSRQKTSLLALADTLFQNFTIDELNELGVDIDIVRQVASTYSHIPQAAKLLSKIQAVLPQTVTRIINVQDIGSDKGHAPYKIQEMYLIYNDGRMITSLMDEEAKVDSDIMSSMLTAINDFVKDSFQTSGNLGSIDYGENQVILERGKHTILASVVYGEANRDLRSRMGRALTKIEDEFGSILKNWDGDIDSLSGSLKHLEPVMDLSKSVTKSMIDELQALKEVSLRSSWSQIAGFVQVNLMINNYSKKQLKGAKFSLEYGADYLKLIKTEPSLKHSVTEVELKPIKANDEVGVTLYFEPLKSTQASLNVHLDYEAKGGQSSGVSTAVFERVDLYKEGASLNVSSLDNASKAEIVTTTAPVEVVESTMGEVEIVEAEVEEVTDAPIEAIEMAAEVVEIVEAEVEEVADAPIVEVEMAAEVVEVVEAEVEEIVDESIEEIVMSSEVEEAEVIEAVPEAEVIEEPAEPAPDPGESGVDDLLSKLSELDDPENAPKKKGKKSDEEEDKSGMDDVLGKLDEL